jgi:hypothetical protein
MSVDSQKKRSRRHYLLPAALLILLLVGAMLVGLWQGPRLLPQRSEGSGTVAPSLTAAPTTTASPTSTLTPTFTPTPTITPTPTPAITAPAIATLDADVDDRAGTITFSLVAEVPPGRQVDEVLLWYDTEAGRRARRFDGPLPPPAGETAIPLSYTLDAALEGLTRTLTTTRELDYWWLVRDTAGDSARAGDTALLGPNLQALAVTPAPAPPPADFTWGISETSHFRFYYVPGTAAERDLALIGGLAEASLDYITPLLDVEFEGQMDIYLVPRVFWQGGAAYGDKVQLISYLDRNYTAIETWSYFTHEGTHALAQDFLQPKAEGEGGPDGVLVEGLAVWASGGHYRREPIDAWAAVVATSDQYLPLAELRAGPFYDFQHETSYLEAASFVKFLIEQYGLPKFKELYGQANSDPTHDEALVQLLYGQDYATLEVDWLAYLEELSPTEEQVETWNLKVRSFDLMRRYETELDPDARLLPNTPTEWTSDTLQIFLQRADAPTNVVLETALIAAQERTYGGDPDGAWALLDDVEAALDAGGELAAPSLSERLAIVTLLAAQDRAILRADAKAYLATLDPASGLAAGVEARLRWPFTAYEQEVVRLDLAADGRSAEGVVLLHAQVADGAFPDDGQLFAVRLSKRDGRWLVSGLPPAAPLVHLLPEPVSGE